MGCIVNSHVSFCCAIFAVVIPRKKTQCQNHALDRLPGPCDSLHRHLLACLPGAKTEFFDSLARSGNSGRGGRAMAVHVYIAIEAETGLITDRSHLKRPFKEVDISAL